MSAQMLSQEHHDASDADEVNDVIFAEINITPLTDVILVLLVIFMVSSSAMMDAMREGKLDINLPKAGQAQTPISPAKQLTVGITSDGRLFIQGEAISDEEFTQKLKTQHQADPGTMVVVEADGALQHRRVVQVLDLVRETGFTNVGIGTQATQ